MNDNPRRYGTDFGNLRAGPADFGRAPGGEDPLAELARLVSQSDPRQEPRAPYGSTGAYGAASNPDYDPQDFFADDFEPQLRGASAENKSFEDDGYDAYDEVDEEIYPAADEDSRDLPISRRNGVITIAAVLGVAVLGGVGAWGYGAFSDNTPAGAPPVIQAAKEPAKSAPATASKEVPHQNKLIYDRVGNEPSGNANVVGGAEEPVERPAAPRRDVSRVILPGANSAPAAAAPPADQPAEIADAPAPATGAEPPRPGAKMVRTFAIRPDGSMGEAPGSAPKPVEMASAAEPQQPGPPQPIVGTGPAAQGMSMIPGRDFGIMTNDSAPEPPAQSAAGNVPVPTARPNGLRTAATTAPQPQAATQPRPTATAPTPLSPPRPAAPQIASIPAAAAGGAFSVQVTSQRSEAEARAAFTALQQRYPQILGNLQPSLQPVTLPDRGTFYRVRIGQPSQGDATTLCTNLKAAGGDCIVQRN